MNRSYEKLEPFVLNCLTVFALFVFRAKLGQEELWEIQETE